MRVGERTVELFGDRRRSLPIVDPEDRELAIGCGAALAYLKLALRGCGIEPEMHCVPNTEWQDLLARVRLGAKIEPDPAAQELLKAAPHRCANRFPFASGGPPAELRERLGTSGTIGGAELRMIEGEEGNASVSWSWGPRAMGRDSRIPSSVASWLPGCVPTAAAPARACAAAASVSATSRRSSRGQ